MTRPATGPSSGLADNAGAADIQLSAADVAELTAGRGAGAPPVPGGHSRQPGAVAHSWRYRARSI